MSELSLSERLSLLADKLNVMWGGSPDADLIREASAALKVETPLAAPKAAAKKA
jgi:hypothetical protein